MTTINLPELPKEKEYEEYISAYFQIGGYYIERNIIEREKEEILELDIIATSYKERIPKMFLLEIKSGDWGFPDLFKMCGWLKHLNFPNGIFVATRDKGNTDFYIKKAKNLNIDLLIVPETNKTMDLLSTYIDKANYDAADMSTLRFSYWTERNMLKILKKLKRSHLEQKRFKAMDHYLHIVNDEVFFLDTVIEKVEKLYSAFQKYPNLSAKSGNEMLGGNFDEQWEQLPNDIYKDTFYKCNCNDIQISTYIEHRARLAVLKNAVDLKLYEKANIRGKIGLLNIPGLESSLLDLLPDSFTTGLNLISKEKYFPRYPLFWQWFMWVFGGFILKDLENEEYTLLSKKTGIPTSEIPNAMNAYEKLFPINNGWFLEPEHSNIKILKMFPVPFMGIGANYRRYIYAKAKSDFVELKPRLSGLYTYNDLLSWNQATINILKKYK